jgi:hypothetical protein
VVARAQEGFFRSLNASRFMVWLSNDVEVHCFFMSAQSELMAMCIGGSLDRVASAGIDLDADYRIY